MRKTRGFSLIEMLSAITISGVLFTALLQSYLLVKGVELAISSRLAFEEKASMLSRLVQSDDQFAEHYVVRKTNRVEKGKPVYGLYTILGHPEEVIVGVKSMRVIKKKAGSLYWFELKEGEFDLPWFVYHSDLS